MIRCFLLRPSSSSAGERTYSGSQQQMRCGSSIRSTRYDAWPFTYWFTHSSPSSLSLQYWLTAYSWSCPLRPSSSLRSEYRSSFPPRQKDESYHLWSLFHYLSILKSIVCTNICFIKVLFLYRVSFKWWLNIDIRIVAQEFKIKIFDSVWFLNGWK